MEQNPEDMGDLYLDVAEAFLDVGEYGSALPLLSALVCSERYNLAVVWLRHAGSIFLWEGIVIIYIGKNLLSQDSRNCYKILMC